MKVAASQSSADSIREHAVEEYIVPARQRRDRAFSINVGEIHKALGLNNLLPPVFSPLISKKFLMEKHPHLISKTVPPSRQSTTVTYTYQFFYSPTENPSTPLHALL